MVVLTFYFEKCHVCVKILSHADLDARLAPLLVNKEIVVLVGGVPIECAILADGVAVDFLNEIAMAHQFEEFYQFGNVGDVFCVVAFHELHR